MRPFDQNCGFDHIYWRILNGKPHILSSVLQRKSLILFKGTTWCIGRKGDDEKPGAFAGLDTCCKAHSLCPEKIYPEKEKYGVQNVIGYTMRDCKCDDAFKKCMVDILIVSIFHWNKISLSNKNKTI